MAVEINSKYTFICMLKLIFYFRQIDKFIGWFIFVVIGSSSMYTRWSETEIRTYFDRYKMTKYLIL